MTYADTEEAALRHNKAKQQATKLGDTFWTGLIKMLIDSVLPHFFSLSHRYFFNSATDIYAVVLHIIFSW